MHAENEHMFPLSHSIEFQEKARKNNVRCEIKHYENAEHGFIYDVTRRIQKVAFNDMLNFISSLN